MTSTAPALSSPVLTALTGDIDRRRLLIGSMLAFAAANFVAWSAHSYQALLVARILLAVAAGLYVPNANALAGALVEPSRRGTALSIVTGGTSVAVALGVPLGALIGDRFGWRLNFAAVGAMALIATAGFSLGAALGSLTLANASPLALGWVGTNCVVAALSLVAVRSRRVEGPSPVAP